MGLDIVELVMEVEEEFGILIPDADYEQISTVGDMHDYICLKLPVDKPRPSSGSTRCLSSAAFLRLRRSLMSVCGVERDRVRLEASLSDLLPKQHRREKWRRLRDDLKLWLPDLERPEWMSQLLCCGGWATVLVPILVCLVYFTDPKTSGHWALLLFPAGIAVTIASYAATTRYAVCFASGYSTVRETSQSLKEKNHFSLARLEGAELIELSTPIYNRLLDIISECLDIPREEIHRESSFMEDLKCD